MNTYARATFDLVEPGPMRDALVDAIRRRGKTVTSELLVLAEMRGTLKGWSIGSVLPVIDSAGASVSQVEITDARIIPIDKVDESISSLEGDWFEDAREWRFAHYRYWSRQLEQIRQYLDDPDWMFTEKTLVVVRTFRVVP